MFAVLAEDRSDADALVILIRRIAGTPNAKILKKGFTGSGELRKGAWRHIRDFATTGASRFIICHDSDGEEPRSIKERVSRSIADAAGSPLRHDHCIIVPIQELEAWIIADEDAIKQAIPSLVIKPELNPEAIPSPKEWLVRASRKGRSRPLYVPTIHNAKVAEHVGLDKVKKKCPSFAELVDYVTTAKSA